MDVDSEYNDINIVYSFAKNNQKAICTGISVWKGIKLIFIRTFVKSLRTDELIPTKEGISITIDKYSELLTAIKSLGEVMGKNKIVAKIIKNNREEIWVGVNDYKGMNLIYVRTYAAFHDGDDLKPTKKGISIRVEQYPLLLEAIEKLGEELN